MCKGSKGKASSGFIMAGDKFQEQRNKGFLKSSILLELAAADDVSGFVSEVEDEVMRLDEVGFWYGRRNGVKRKMGFEERTPLMIASVYGSTQVLKYLIGAGIDVNKTSDSDGATALHCAAVGGSSTSVETVKLLLHAGADPGLTDDNGNKPADLIARGLRSSKRKALEMLLMGFAVELDEAVETDIVAAKKEYPIDVSLPDINDGVYGSDEFRMYMFKVKPCSRAYSHDWTECPFVHPGENARRRDPRKYQYSCVPCPEFRKGSCTKSDGCEYAHGVFESWLHPAQYRTRLCKDETGCSRKVCFFAHKIDELRPLYASTGSAVPSPKLASVGSMSPLGRGSTPPLSPSPAPANGWHDKFVHLTPPGLQLPGSRLKTSLNARDLEIELELLGMENIRTRHQQRQQMIDDVFSSPMAGIPSQQLRQNTNQLRSTYPSPPTRKPTSYGFDSSAALAQAVMNSRSGGFGKQRSQSFIDRGAGTTMPPLTYSEWGSPDGKLEWGFNGEEANKLRKSASFGLGGAHMKVSNDGDGSWVGAGVYSCSEKVPHWVEQMDIEQELLMA